MKIVLMSVLLAGGLASNLFCMEYESEKAEYEIGQSITLVSSDGQEFVIENKDAQNMNLNTLVRESETIKNLLEDAGLENSIPLPNVTGKMLTYILHLLGIIKGGLQEPSDEQIVAIINGANYLDIQFILSKSLTILRKKLRSLGVKKFISLLEPLSPDLIKKLLKQDPAFNLLLLYKQTLEPLFSIKKEGYLVAIWSPNDKFIAIRDEDTVSIWDVAKKQHIVSQEIKSNTSGPIGKTIAWSPDSNQLAIASFEKEKGYYPIRFYNVSNNELELIEEQTIKLNHFPHMVGWNPAGSYLLVGTSLSNKDYIEGKAPLK